jgi:signal transduction histidine kinase
MARFASLTHFAALAITLSITLVSWYVAGSFVNGLATQKFDDEVAQVVLSTHKRMEEYEQVLIGGKGLFAASEQVSREEWIAFVRAQSIQQRFPGIQGVGYIQHVLPEEVPALVAQVRAEGFADFDVLPKGERPEYYPVIYIEPLDERNSRAFGYDTFSEPVRRAAVELSRDTGKTTITGKITLVQETGQDVQAGFLMLIPVYENGAPAQTVQERRDGIEGFVYAPFRMNDLMQRIIGATSQDVTFAIYAGEPSEEELMFDLTRVASIPEGSIDRSFAKTVLMEIGGRTWTIEFLALDSIRSQADTLVPYIILGVGIVLSGILFYVLRSTARFHDEAGELMRAAEHVGEGNLDVQVGQRLLDSPTGMGNLARVFDRMRSGVKASTEDLKKANEELVRVDKMKEEFSSMVSHELRSPLTPIKFGADALLDGGSGSLTDDQKRYAGMIMRNATKLENLINDLMDSYKLDMNKLTLNMKENDIAQMVAQCLADAEPYTREKQVRIESDVRASGIVVCDRKRIDQVVANLVKNSVDFVPEKTGRIVVRVEEGGPDVVFSVEDNGIGIPADKADRLFEKFYQVDTSAKRKFGGSGLGLPISKGIVEAHGGRIWVDKEFRGGAAIRFALPRKPSA